MQTDSFSPKHIWGTDHWSPSVSVADSATYVAIRIGTAQIEQVARLVRHHGTRHKTLLGHKLRCNIKCPILFLGAQERAESGVHVHGGNQAGFHGSFHQAGKTGPIDGPVSRKRQENRRHTSDGSPRPYLGP